MRFLVNRFRKRKMKFTEAETIQFVFPEKEPDWAFVKDSVLVELVKGWELSCATSALYELYSRDYPEVEELCIYLLDDTLYADKWLKHYALEILLSTNFIRGIEKSLSLVENCSIEILSIILRELTVKFHGDLKQLIINHEITNKVRDRLLSGDDKLVKDSTVFYEYFGKIKGNS